MTGMTLTSLCAVTVQCTDCVFEKKTRFCFLLALNKPKQSEQTTRVAQWFGLFGLPKAGTSISFRTQIWQIHQLELGRFHLAVLSVHQNTASLLLLSDPFRLLPERTNSNAVVRTADGLGLEIPPAVVRLESRSD